MAYDKNSTIDFWDAVNNLMSGIKDDYYNWTNPNGAEGNMKDIKLRSIKEFNETLNIKVGRKYTKVLTDNSVWGFIIYSRPLTILSCGKILCKYSNSGLDNLDEAA